MDVFYLRAAERLFIVISGLVCIIIGYGLFRLSYTKMGESNAELVAKGAGFELTLRSIWPGVIFAAFGMIILAISMVTQLKAQSSTDPDSPNKIVLYQGGGTPPVDSKTRVKDAIFTIGELLALEASGAEGNNNKRATVISRLESAQISLVDVAYGQGSYDRFAEIASISRTSSEFSALPEDDRQFFEELRNLLQR